MKKRVMLCAAVVISAVLVIHILAGVVFFYAIPSTLSFSPDAFYEDQYDYPSVVINKPADTGGTYYYPLASIETEDDCEYRLVKDGLLGYTVDSSSFLKRHKHDLVVYNCGYYYGTTYDSCYKLYRDDELIDMVPCIYFDAIDDRTYSFDFIMHWGATSKAYVLIYIALLCAYVVIMRYCIVKARGTKGKALEQASRNAENIGVYPSEPEK